MTTSDAPKADEDGAFPPPAPPRLVATDLDGTLLGPDGAVSAYTREVLLALEERNVPVVFVTGRPIRWMEHLWEEVGGHGLAILSNGGIVYDVASHSVRRARTIAPDVLVRVARLLRSAVPGTTFALEKTTGFSREPDFMPRLKIGTDPGVPVAPLEELVDGEVVKLLARHEAQEPEEFWRLAEEAVGHEVTTTWSSVGTLVEISGAGVTKATTLAELCGDLGVTRSEVVAFGDMPNDLPLLDWAGHAYAMENAHPSLRAGARHVAPHHAADGVARTLARLFGL
ncbi:HAD family hydrolase [Nocardioides jishulii]|uniref:HAD family phosphatase n=1 Tax=Nocardioides jishulii TaxID=2575440 RepID=A0A4U2YRR9_9ACTN|nr:HAD family hydrolase [Nocardioides jishulii]QCX28914.1 HAD family phosphatase [Nocardioides jishulii]TKI64186.1 HAD family phosphatase [Nocardioides jishulii]